MSNYSFKSKNSIAACVEMEAAHRRMNQKKEAVSARYHEHVAELMSQKEDGLKLSLPKDHVFDADAVEKEAHKTSAKNQSVSMVALGTALKQSTFADKEYREAAQSFLDQFLPEVTAEYKVLEDDFNASLAELELETKRLKAIAFERKRALQDYKNDCYDVIIRRFRDVYYHCMDRSDSIYGSGGFLALNLANTQDSPSDMAALLRVEINANG